MTTEAAGLGLTDVLAEHIELLWGASQAGHWYAYCRCGEWSATSESGEAVAESHRAHVAEEVRTWLRAALTSPEVVEGRAHELTDEILHHYGYTDADIAAADAVHPGRVCDEDECWGENGESIHPSVYAEAGGTASVVIDVVMPWLEKRLAAAAETLGAK